MTRSTGQGDPPTVPSREARERLLAACRVAPTKTGLGDAREDARSVQSELLGTAEPAQRLVVLAFGEFDLGKQHRHGGIARIGQVAPDRKPPAVVVVEAACDRLLLARLLFATGPHQGVAQFAMGPGTAAVELHGEAQRGLRLLEPALSQADLAHSEIQLRRARGARQRLDRDRFRFVFAAQRAQDFDQTHRARRLIPIEFVGFGEHLGGALERTFRLQDQPLAVPRLGVVRCDLRGAGKADLRVLHAAEMDLLVAEVEPGIRDFGMALGRRAEERGALLVAAEVGEQFTGPDVRLLDPRSQLDRRFGLLERRGEVARLVQHEELLLARLIERVRGRIGGGRRVVGRAAAGKNDQQRGAADGRRSHGSIPGRGCSTATTPRPCSSVTIVRGAIES